MDSFPERIAQYRILRVLGTGGMATVFLAQDERLQRQVALKLLSSHATDSIATEARFLQEARAAARLDHPNVCAIFEVGEAPEGNFIAMQLVDGETLAARMGRRRLNLTEAIDIAVQVLDALAEAHSKGIVHRDIKPANIMLTPKGQVKVLDFGLAKSAQAGNEMALSSLTQSGMVVGTVPYMSPEQLKAEPLDGRSDIFSVGALLYEMASDKRPFLAKSGAEVMSAILKDSPPLLVDPDSCLPPPLQRILRHALEKEPSQRYSTAAAFRDELETLRQGIAGCSDALTAAQPQSGASGMVAAVVKSGQVLRRHQGLRWSFTTLLAVLGVGGVAWFAVPAILQQRQAIESVAVLPIQNASGDPELDWMCEGLAEQLTNQLSRLPKLKVIARSSVLRYKGPDLDLPAVGRDLGVRALLVGRLVQRQGQASLSFELVQAADRRQLWGQRIDRPAEHLVDTQNLLAEEVSLALAGRRSPSDRLALAEGRVRTSSEAYQLYLKGRHHADKFTPEDLGRAMAYFEQALAKDPKFALAHVGIANAYWGMSSTFKPSGEVMPKVMAEAQKALALNPDIAEAHTALGIATFILKRDHAAAEASLRSGIAFGPGSSQAHAQFGYFLSLHGRKEEAMRELDQAVELDPRSSNSHFLRAIAHTFFRDTKLALKDAYRAHELEPESWFSLVVAAVNEHRSSNTHLALSNIEKAVSSGSSYALAYKGYLLAKCGFPVEAEKILATLEETKVSGKSFVSPIYLAYIKVGLGRNSEAMKNLLEAESMNEEATLLIKADPLLDPLRSRPDFQALLRKLGFEPA